MRCNKYAVPFFPHVISLNTNKMSSKCNVSHIVKYHMLRSGHGNVGKSDRSHKQHNRRRVTFDIVRLRAGNRERNSGSTCGYIRKLLGCWDAVGQTHVGWHQTSLQIGTGMTEKSQRRCVSKDAQMSIVRDIVLGQPEVTRISYDQCVKRNLILSPILTIFNIYRG